MSNINYVFIIGLDGAGNTIKDVETPNMDKVFSKGVVTYEADASSPTISAECWGSLFHGVKPDKHQLTNGIVGKYSYPENSEYPSFMKLAREKWEDCSLAAFSCWGPINTGIIEDSCRCYNVSKPDQELVEDITKYISDEDPKILFVQFDYIDHMGHEYGYRTEEYYEQIRLTDEYIGKIIDAIKESGKYEESLIILTADHGGGGENIKRHGSDHPYDKKIFWGCSGPGIKKGVAIEDQVDIMDTAMVVAHALDLSVPKSWDAKLPIGIFEDCI